MSWEEPQREPALYFVFAYMIRVALHSPAGVHLIFYLCLTCYYLVKLSFFFSYVGCGVQRNNCFDRFCLLTDWFFLLQIVWNYLFFWVWHTSVCHSKCFSFLDKPCPEASRFVSLKANVAWLTSIEGMWAARKEYPWYIDLAIIQPGSNTESFLDWPADP